MAYWLMKSEPDVYAYADLVQDGRTHWDGVRNYQARNMMRDAMAIGDLVLYRGKASFFRAIGLTPWNAPIEVVRL